MGVIKGRRRIVLDGNCKFYNRVCVVYRYFFEQERFLINMKIVMVRYSV